MTETIQFTDVTLRDGQQSLSATRMTTEQALRVLPHLCEAGFRTIELWGGATLDSCIRFTDEDPWERLESFARVVNGSARIQALVRGQSLFGYQPYPDDLVLAFTHQAVQSGVGVMRIFDALNDFRNIQTALLAAKAYGAKAEAALSYTVSPVHTSEYFVNFAALLKEEGADQIAIKDMAGILHPTTAVQLIPAIKQRVNVPLSLHSHSTAGVALLNAVIAMRTGIDSIDTAVTPFAGGSSLPPVEVLVAFAEELGLAHNLNPKAILRAQEELFVIADELRSTSPFFGKFYRPVRFEDVDRDQVQQILKLLDAGGDDAINAALRLTHQMLASLAYPDHDDRIFKSQIPGGMLTNLYDQIRQMGQPPEIMDQVMLEIPQVRADVGYVPLVTPTSQIVGSQAAFNVISGDRYRFVSEEFKMILRGEFGRTPAEPNPWVVEKVLGSDEARLKYRPAFYLKPALEDCYPQPFIRSRKDLLLHLLFGKNADDFLLKHCPVSIPQYTMSDEIICF